MEWLDNPERFNTFKLIIVHSYLDALFVCAHVMCQPKVACCVSQWQTQTGTCEACTLEAETEIVRLEGSSLSC